MDTDLSSGSCAFISETVPVQGSDRKEGHQKQPTTTAQGYQMVCAIIDSRHGVPMMSKARRQQALIEATASLRLEGLPIFRQDDDLYAAAIDGLRARRLRDAVLARVRAELASMPRSTRR